MSKASRIWLGIFTFMPIALIVAYLVTFGFLVKDILLYGPQDKLPLVPGMLWLFLVVLAMGIISFGLLVYYIILAMNAKMDPNEKLLWILLFVLGTVLVFPVYWYFRIWKQPVDHFTMSAT